MKGLRHAILKTFFGSLVVGAVAIPIAAIVTVLLWPFWGWIETRFGIESVGHSGPANWCFVAVYGLLLGLAFAIWLFVRRKRRPIGSQFEKVPEA